ncbi:MAG: hypothetical protein M1118_03365 [Chloroflexi bacterium]|nr:hypothetical protein [Chloroflexota bacterium]
MPGRAGPAGAAGRVATGARVERSDADAAGAVPGVCSVAGRAEGAGALPLPAGAEAGRARREGSFDGLLISGSFLMAEQGSLLSE